VTDPDLQIRGGPGHLDPEIEERGGGGGAKKIFVWPFGPQSGLKMEGGRHPRGPSPGSTTYKLK